MVKWATLVFGLALVHPVAAEQVDGKIKRVLPERSELVVVDGAGKLWTFRVEEQTKVRVSGREKPWTSLNDEWKVSVRFERREELLVALAVDVPTAMYFHRIPQQDRTEYAHVQVFYGTDRQSNEELNPDWRWYAWKFVPCAVAAVVTLLISIVAFRRGHWVAKVFFALGLLATLGLGAIGVNDCNRQSGGPVDIEELYGNERGRNLYLGTCTVTIPREHELGRLEGPSILRFEVRYDPKKHVTLESVDPSSQGEFFESLRDRVRRSERKEAFVFIHGFNTTFAEAARRTAQLAYDLEFDGVPIFFSWPSRGHFLEYTIDESNVEWACADLERFLHDLAIDSGAETIHLIAHSMGNRALVGALRSLAVSHPQDTARFEQVVLAAPDIDAQVFQRDLVPALTKHARRVTLYASSKDEALAASKRVHGYARAGESGENLVVVPGLDTIDVSAVDTSLIGHSYYGDNKGLLFDLFSLVNQRLAPPRRVLLRRAERNGVPYWIFQRAVLPPAPW